MREGRATSKTWSEEEVQILRDFAKRPTMLKLKLRKRSWLAITCMAKKLKIEIDK